MNPIAEDFMLRFFLKVKGIGVILGTQIEIINYDSFIIDVAISENKNAELRAVFYQCCKDRRLYGWEINYSVKACPNTLLVSNLAA